MGVVAPSAPEIIEAIAQRTAEMTAVGADPHHKIGGRLVIHSDELDAWLDRYREGRSH